MIRGRTTGKYLVCLQCRRVFPVSELEKERREKKRDHYVCPYCGSTNFTNNFSDIVLIIDPKESKVARFLKIIHPGVFAYSLE